MRSTTRRARVWIVATSPGSSSRRVVAKAARRGSAAAPSATSAKKDSTEAGLLDIAVAAEALQALARVGGGALGDPVLEHGVGDALQALGLLVAGDRLV